MKLRTLLLGSALLMAGGCSAVNAIGDRYDNCMGQDAYTLYRSSATNNAIRVHVATFDTTSGDQYNAGNCETTKNLFQYQTRVPVKYWCERGRYKP